MRLKDAMQKVTPVTLAIAFIVLLSFYNFKLYTNNNYTLFDLGLGYRLSYLFSQTFAPVGWPIPHELVSATPYTKMFYMVTGLTMLLYDSPLTLLIDQTIVIGLGSYALFRIAEIKTGSFRVALTFQILYFLFPSTYGYMAQGGNYMVFLEGFLLLNYMFFLQKKWFFFLVTGVLGAITNSWAPGIFFLLYLIEYIRRIQRDSAILSPRQIAARLSQYLNLMVNRLRSAGGFGSGLAWLRAKSRSMWAFISGSQRRVGLPVAMIAIFWIAVFVFEAHIYTFGGLLRASRIGALSSGSSSATGATGFSLLLNNETIPKIVYAGGQLLPMLFTPVFSLFALPAIAYFVIVGVTTNYVPYYNLFEQYPYLYSGFLFISAVTVIAKLSKKKILNTLLILMVLSSIISFALLSPFSVGNITSGRLANQLGDSTSVSNLNHAYSLIPVHSSVFIQNDMPQLMNRDKVYIDGYYNNQTVDYAVMNPLTLNNIMSAFGGFSLYWANHFANNNSYRIYESVQGLIVYRLGYQGNPIYYVPYGSSQSIGLSYATGQRLTTDQFSSSSMLLSPGNFSVTYSFSNVSDQKIISHIAFTAYSETGQILPLQIVSVNESATHPGQYYVQLNYSTRLFHQVDFCVLSTNGLISSASLTIDSVSVTQVGP